MSNQDIAVATFKYFSGLEGNQHIASEFALKTIVDIVDKYKTENVLELGLGIGSIAYCIQDFYQKQHRQLNYVGTEANAFCLNALSQYLKEYYAKVQIFNTLKDIETTQKFDLIIIDGTDENVLKIKNMIADNGIIIIEGDRIPQLKIIREIFPKSLYTRVISNYKSPDYGPFPPDSFSGGLQLIFTNPTLKQKIDFAVYKIKTAINYRLR
ncbi:hypothetical protein WMW71_07720 [Flavobacterium buctense]|uniref:Methyltransferase domain-containing protein n=1 Tax=Flavobacterium buctense TaxID=1648146 RepID=A0ABU9E0Q8_9FLAO|nr:hypothetical protein [Flavobacterium buctense]